MHSDANGPVLAGVQVYATPKVVPPAKEMSEIVAGAGGKVPTSVAWLVVVMV